MSTKSCRLIFAGHGSIASSSGFSKGNLGLYEEKFVGDKNWSFTSCFDGAVKISWTTDLRVAGSKPLSVNRFFSKSQFQRCSSDIPFCSYILDARISLAFIQLIYPVLWERVQHKVGYSVLENDTARGRFSFGFPLNLIGWTDQINTRLFRVFSNLHGSKVSPQKVYSYKNIWVNSLV